MITYCNKTKRKFIKLLTKKRRSRLRVYVVGESDNLKYGFVVGTHKNDDDHEIEIGKDCSLIIDNITMRYLVNSTITFKKGWLSTKFIIDGPFINKDNGQYNEFVI